MNFKHITISIKYLISPRNKVNINTENNTPKGDWFHAKAGCDQGEQERHDGFFHWALFHFSYCTRRSSLCCYYAS